jgi:hypothetical protein
MTMQPEALTSLIPSMTPVVIVPGNGPTHWRCPDCFQPCSCNVAIRDLMPHVRCGHSDLRDD